MRACMHACLAYSQSISISNLSPCQAAFVIDIVFEMASDLGIVILVKPSQLDLRRNCLFLMPRFNKPIFKSPSLSVYLPLLLLCTLSRPACGLLACLLARSVFPRLFSLWHFFRKKIIMIIAFTRFFLFTMLSAHDPLFIENHRPGANKGED